MFNRPETNLYSFECAVIKCSCKPCEATDIEASEKPYAHFHMSKTFSDEKFITILFLCFGFLLVDKIIELMSAIYQGRMCFIKKGRST